MSSTDQHQELRSSANSRLRVDACDFYRAGSGGGCDSDADADAYREPRLDGMNTHTHNSAMCRLHALPSGNQNG